MSAVLADLTWPDAERGAADAVLAVPIGSTEQHGPHLPLSTDTDIAVALALALAHARPAVAVAPAIPYGSSGEHAGFAGTLSIGQQAVAIALVELCRSASATFQRILLISAHGGNAEPLDRARRRLCGEGREVRAWAPSWGGDAHAGRTETSLMLALRPEHVRRDKASAGNVAPVAGLLPRLRASGVQAVSPYGVLGDPAGASADEGHELLRAASEELVAMVDSWERGA
jgi:creatinine amidohydrolase